MFHLSKIGETLRAGNKKIANILNNELKNDSNELSDQEMAIRCQINFERLLHKTLILCKDKMSIIILNNNKTTINTNNIRPLNITISQYYLSLEFEYETLKKYKDNINVNIDFTVLPQYSKSLKTIQDWINININNDTNKESNNDNNNIEYKREQLSRISSITNTIQNDNIKPNNIIHSKNIKQRRVMRFSEKIKKKNESNKLDKWNKKKMKSNKNIKDSNPGNDIENERKQLCNDLLEMTFILKSRMNELKKTVNKDKQKMNELSDTTSMSFDRVNDLNKKLTKYVETHTGWTCQLVCMMFIVIIMFIWTFSVIYFI